MGFEITPELIGFVYKYPDDMNKIIHARQFLGPRHSESDSDEMEIVTTSVGGVGVGGGGGGRGGGGGGGGGVGGTSCYREKACARLLKIEEQKKAARILAADQAEEAAITPKCILCMTGVKEYMCYPCKHVLFCRHCFAGDGMWRNRVNGMIPCPVCRTMATVEKIFL